MQSVFFKAILIFNDPDVNKAAHMCLRTTLNLCCAFSNSPEEGAILYRNNMLKPTAVYRDRVQQ